jgi:hypothetical protein
MFSQNFEKIAIKAGVAKRWISGRGKQVPEMLKKIKNDTHLKPRTKEHYTALKAGLSEHKKKT